MCFVKLENKRKTRETAMNKLTNIVHSGWMIKSPPEQKLQSPLKLFRAKWKQRFFVLHKPTGSLHDQYELSYYNSEQCSKKKGSIDLEQCEQIIESLDSDQYPHLLAIKTFFKGKVRTYYLATKTEDSMTSWVQCLCHVCGLKQEDTPTDIPDPRLAGGGHAPSLEHASTSREATFTTLGAPHSSSSSTVTSQPGSQSSPSRAGTAAMVSSTSSSGSQPALSTSPQSYVFLNNCTTGTTEKRSDRYGRTDSVDSVPEYQAPPPPPMKKGSFLHNNNFGEDFAALKPSGSSSSSDAAGQELYDRPPLADSQDLHRPRSGIQELYDRPRSGELRRQYPSSDDIYKVPPPSSSRGLTVAGPARGTNVDLNSAVPLSHSPRASVDSLGNPIEDYDIPPSSPKRPVEVYDVPPSSGGGGSSETYDVPPTGGFHDRPGVETYDVPPSAESWSSRSSRPASENYDYPPPRTMTQHHQDKEVNMNTVPTPPQRPPKPQGMMYQNMHRVTAEEVGGGRGGGLNAVPAAPPARCTQVFSYDVPRASTPASPPRDPNSILDIAPPPRPVPTPRVSTAGLGGGQVYQNTPPVLPPLPAERNGDRRDAEHHGKAGGDRESQDLYQVPPVAPRVPSRSTTLPATSRAVPSSSATGPSAVPGEGEAYFIWSNTRTKSFKRNNQVNVNLNSNAPPARPSVETRRPPLPLRSNEVASSSDDDDDVSVDGCEIQTHVDPGVFRMSTQVPVASDHDLEPELRYLDLDLPPDPSRSQHVSASHSRGTEYREIDFDKTQALQDARRVRRQ